MYTTLVSIACSDIELKHVDLIEKEKDSLSEMVHVSTEHLIFSNLSIVISTAALFTLRKPRTGNTP